MDGLGRAHRYNSEFVNRNTQRKTAAKKRAPSQAPMKVGEIDIAMPMPQAFIVVKVSNRMVPISSARGGASGGSLVRDRSDVNEICAANLRLCRGNSIFSTVRAGFEAPWKIFCGFAARDVLPRQKSFTTDHP
jgi:hypothetical protein